MSLQLFQDHIGHIRNHLQQKQHGESAWREEELKVAVLKEILSN